jgi:hypothetical protein
MPFRRVRRDRHHEHDAIHDLVEQQRSDVMGDSIQHRTTHNRTINGEQVATRHAGHALFIEDDPSTRQLVANFFDKHNVSARARDPNRDGFRFDGWRLERRARRLLNPKGNTASLTKREFAFLVAATMSE